VSCLVSADNGDTTTAGDDRGVDNIEVAVERAGEGGEREETGTTKKGNRKEQNDKIPGGIRRGMRS
jgi:hypothetical protein